MDASKRESLNEEQAQQILASLQDIERALDRDDVAQGLTISLVDFFRKAWAILNPETPLVWSWHYEYLCEWLTLVSNGSFKKLYPGKLGIIINVPPRSAKSLLVTVIWTTWTWLEHPERRFLCASYSGGLSKDHAKYRRDLIGSPWFQELFHHRFAITVDRVDDLRNDKTGYFIATSVGGSGTGFGGDICIGDDLLSGGPEGELSVATRLSTNNWLDSVWRRRLNNATTGVFVHISQRLGDDDPTGHLLEKSPEEWLHIKIKREAEENETYNFPLSGKVLERPKGDILQPERYPPTVIASMKKSSREWAGQEQQEPAPSGGIVFNPNWWTYYDSQTPLPSFDTVALSVDATFEGNDESDYVCIQKWGRTGPRSVLLWQRLEHLGYVGTKAAIKADVQEQEAPWCLEPIPAASILLIERAANGHALLQELKNDPNIKCTVIGIKPKDSKDARAYAASADAEAGNITLPIDAPWCGKMVTSFAHWAGEGSIKHDDEIDAASQFINWARKRAWGVLDLWKEIAANRKTPPTAEELHAMPPKEVEKLSGKDQVLTYNQGATSGIFGAEKKLVPAKVAPVQERTAAFHASVPQCPKCQNKVLARYGEIVKCACGWSNAKN